MKIVLASASPRRRELLRELGIGEMEILPASREEPVEPGTPPEEAVCRLAQSKAAQVSALRPEDLVIGADTLVALDGELLGKPRDAEDAVRMLKRLSGREHQVYTGVCLALGDRRLVEAEMTAVRFRRLDQDEIQAYVATGEPLDKAGAYGVQGIGRLLVEGIRGDYYNTVGLPVCRLYTMLKSLGVDIWKIRGSSPRKW